MRILIVAPMLPRPEGPGAIPILLHAQLLALAPRHEVTFVAGYGDEEWEREVAGAGTPAADGSRRLLEWGAELHLAARGQPPAFSARQRRRIRLASRWLSSRLPWRTLWFNQPPVQRLVDRLIAEREFDLVAVEDSAMASIRLPSGLPSLLTDHEVQRAPQALGGRRALRSAVTRTLVRIDDARAAPHQASMWRRFDLTQVFTDADARAIESTAPDAAARVRVNPFGIAMADLAPAAEEEADTVCFVGNFTHPPNADAAEWLASEIMPAIWRQRPQVKLRLAGSSPPATVRALADDRIELLADVPDAAPVLDSSAVCLAPVRLGGGMRMKVLSAMASGRAVVTTTTGAAGYSVAVPESPLIVADDAESIAAAAVGLLADERRRRRLGEVARGFAREHHSPEAWGRRLDVVYEELAARGARPTKGRRR